MDFEFFNKSTGEFIVSATVHKSEGLPIAIKICKDLLKNVDYLVEDVTEEYNQARLASGKYALKANGEIIWLG